MHTTEDFSVIKMGGNGLSIKGDIYADLRFADDIVLKAEITEIIEELNREE